MFNRNLYVPKRVRERKTDVVVQRGYLDEDEFLITLPSNIKPEKLLPSVNLVTDFGVFQIEMEWLDDNKIRYKRKLEVVPGVYPKERYKEFRDFRKKIARIDNSKIVLKKT